jgi:hypothetical protein
MLIESMVPAQAAASLRSGPAAGEQVLSIFLAL